MSEKSELHVIFGTGPVGLTIAQQLRAAGKQVRAVNRSGKAPMPEGVERVKGDAMQLSTVRELSKDATVVYNCTHAPYQDWPQILPTLQHNMIEGVAPSGAKLVLIDTLYMYGQTHGKPMTESSPYAATTRKGQFRAQIATNYLQAHRSGKLRVAIGRAADFYGPYVLNSSMGDRIFPQALAGQTVTVLGNRKLIHSYSYMPDIAAGLIALGQHEEALGREWLLPTLADKTPQQMVEEIGKQLGRHLKVRSATKLLVRGLGLFDPFMREYVELFYQHTEPQIVDSSAIAKTFNLRPTLIEQAIRETLEWYKSRD